LSISDDVEPRWQGGRRPRQAPRDLLGRVFPAAAPQPRRQHLGPRRDMQHAQGLEHLRPWQHATRQVHQRIAPGPQNLA
jgi:hypothetical protein